MPTGSRWRRDSSAARGNPVGRPHYLRHAGRLVRLALISLNDLELSIKDRFSGLIAFRNVLSPYSGPLGRAIFRGGLPVSYDLRRQTWQLFDDLLVLLR